jgi:hypothetical protein
MPYLFGLIPFNYLVVSVLSLESYNLFVSPFPSFPLLRHMAVLFFHSITAVAPGHRAVLFFHSIAAGLTNSI